MMAGVLPTTARWVAGVDGCQSGWVIVLRDRVAATHSARIVPDFAGVLALSEAPAVIAIDIPIGLLDLACRGGRPCEISARQILRARASSVFSAPTRAALAAFRSGGDYPAVSLANRGGVPLAPGISQQTFGILPKISDVDQALRPEDQHRVREVHPELCFAEANGGTPMQHSKKRSAGRTERASLLGSLGFVAPLEVLGSRLPTGAKPDDLLDACIACWTAERILDGTAAVVPNTRHTDARGLRMELWR